MHHQEIREIGKLPVRIKDLSCIDDIPMVESTIKSKSVQRDKAKGKFCNISSQNFPIHLEFIQEERNNAKIDLNAHGRDHRSEFSDSPINEISKNHV